MSATMLANRKKAEITRVKPWMTGKSRVDHGVQHRRAHARDGEDVFDRDLDADHVAELHGGHGDERDHARS